jgi:NAD(P)-dependent dehydrogenase (short-subunit alcohol dehydrogenase family)
MRFEGSRVVVTGSSRNTGLGIARRFSAEGARVVVTGSNAARVETAVAAVPGSVGSVADLGTKEGIASLFEVVDRELGGVDVLVNNAVDQGLGPTFLDVEDELIESVIAVNVLGYYRCAQAAARRMVAQGVRGAIVNLSSNTSERAVRARTAYCTSKGAIDAMTRAIAVDLAPHGIRVNAVAPGFIYTERWETLSPELVQGRRDFIPLGEPASSDDVASAVLFLASPEAGNITGARLVVDGGVTVQFAPPGVKC